MMAISLALSFAALSARLHLSPLAPTKLFPATSPLIRVVGRTATKTAGAPLRSRPSLL